MDRALGRVQREFRVNFETGRVARVTSLVGRVKRTAWTNDQL